MHLMVLRIFTAVPSFLVIMRKIIHALRIRPINGFFMLAVVILYLSNNFYIKSHSCGLMQWFFICFFNDLICPLFFVSYANTLLLTVGKEIRKLHHILALCLSAGLFWELGGPLLKPTATTDFWDILFYLLGGFIYWIFLTLSSKNDSHNDGGLQT